MCVYHPVREEAVGAVGEKKKNNTKGANRRIVRESMTRNRTTRECSPSRVYYSLDTRKENVIIYLCVSVVCSKSCLFSFLFRKKEEEEEF